MRVKELIIYPIKGLAGISKSKVHASQSGFDWDRKLMLIDAQDKFVSQRTFSEMCLFKTRFEAHVLIVSYGGEDCKIDLIDIDARNDAPAEIWEQAIRVNTCKSQINDWFSRHLKQPVRLVQTAVDFTRIKVVKTLDKKVPLSLADGYPFLILGTASMENLNSKLESPVSSDRFRANIIVDTTEAHEEDNYQQFTLGSAKLEVAKPCARCQVIGINQRTAEKSKEVIASLSQYRKKDNKIFFGANLICNQEGTISVGDEIIFKN